MLAVTLVACASGSVGVSSAGSTATSDYFVMPSRNIICLGSAADGVKYLRCQIASGLNPRPKRPAGCDTDWGYGLTLTSRSRAEVLCAGDTIFRGWKPALPYRTTWRKYGFECVSRETGLRCTATAGHGFFLSRETWRRIKP